MQENEDNQKPKLSLTNAIALAIAFGGIISGYIELKSDINDLKKESKDYNEYRTKVDLKLDKIIDNVTQIRVDNAEQRVLDAQKKYDNK